MNLALVTHNVVRGDGQGRINLEIVRHALMRGHQVALYSIAVQQEMIDIGAKWVKINPLIRKPNLVKVRSFAPTVDRLLRAADQKYDAIVGNGFTLRHPHNVNLCQFVHGAWIHSPVHVAKLQRGPRSWYQWLYTTRNAKYEKSAYGAAKFVVAPSQKIRQELLSIGVPDAKIRVIYNGVDLNEFQPGLESRAELGLSDAKPLALFVGDIRTPRKNLDTTLKALVRLPDVHLAVAGAVARSPFPQMAKDLGISDRVTFLDFRGDIGRLMRAVDLFVFPSRYEAGTLVLLEALASGLPVVTARTAGGCEVMGDGAGKIIENPDDVDALAAAIGQMARDDNARQQAAINARHVAERYSWTNMAQAYLDLIEESRR